MLFINLNIGKGSGHNHSRTDYLDDTSYGSGNFPNWAAAKTDPA
jgi:hypothetical protein